ncbi:MAG: glycoside hydrolase family 3 [Candidatus Marinimicrobia bacterium]|nr:glycoside hydrolase family 3 [Candidatus Neomarinimicrobiota bacterium]
MAQSPQDARPFDKAQLEQEIGQMLMVGIRGTEMNNEFMEQTRKQIENGAIGGIIFFKHNIKDGKQLGDFIHDLNELSVQLPLLLAVDEEGGKARRLKISQGFEEFPSAADVGDKLNLDEAFKVYSRMASQIHATGLNLNFGPVVDVNINHSSPAIGKLRRSFSSDPEKVYQYSKAFINAHRNAGVLTTLKHYPGHGSSREDTHNDLTDITKTWEKDEQLPFAKLIDSSMVDIIMAGHLFDQDLDIKYPASLSAVHIQDNLRDKLGYEGVVITDDLQMGAIIKRFSLEEIIIAAVNSGSDILQFSDPRNLDDDLPQKMQNVILTAINEGKIKPERIHESYTRIVELKRKLDISSNKTVE